MKNKSFKPKSNNKKFKKIKKDVSKNKSSSKKIEEDVEFDSIDDIEKAYEKFEEDEFEDLEDEEADLEEEEMEKEIESMIENESQLNEDDDQLEDDDEMEDDDDDDDDDSESIGYINEKSLKKLEKELSANLTAVDAFKKIQIALSAAVESIKGCEEEKQNTSYKVKDPQIFNQIVRVCLNKVPSTLHRLFKLKTLSDRPVKNKRWTKLITSLKKYLKNIILLIKSISEPTMIERILKKGTLPLLPFYAEFPNLSWLLTKQIASFWCTSEEKVRVLSVIVLFRLMSSFKTDTKEKVLKMLYVSFVQNCRFTSPTSWPLIDFMRMSLAELYSMDQALAYRHAFIYIRQLASHLRNAMLIQKKERTQLVYNWQFVHCLHFWCELLAKTHPSEILGPLIYPVIQISHGLVTLMKSPLYYPLTFHVCNILTELSDKTDIFIPVLPYLMEVLTSQRLRKNPQKKSDKPFEWNCIIKVSKAQLEESAFREGLVEQIFSSSIKYLNTQCNSIGFPELVFPFTIQLKNFLKKCKVPTYTRKMKQLLDKMNENSQHIDEKRRHVSFKISDSQAIRNWEIEVSQNIPPFRAFTTQWNQMNKELMKREREEAQDDEDDESNERPAKKRKNFRSPHMNYAKQQKKKFSVKKNK